MVLQVGWLVVRMRALLFVSIGLPNGDSMLMMLWLRPWIVQCTTLLMHLGGDRKIFFFSVAVCSFLQNPLGHMHSPPRPTLTAHQSGA